MNFTAFLGKVKFFLYLFLLYFYFISFYLLLFYSIAFAYETQCHRNANAPVLLLRAFLAGFGGNVDIVLPLGVRARRPVSVLAAIVRTQATAGFDRSVEQ